MDLQCCSQLLCPFFNGDNDARKFFFVFENIFEKSSSDEEKATRVVGYLTQKAFEFYYETFVREGIRRPESSVYSTVKAALLAKFGFPSRSQYSVIKEAATLKFCEGDIDVFVSKAEKLYREAGFNDCTMRGFILDAFSTHTDLKQFLLLRGADSFDDIRKA
eukprot:IDg5040t1